MFMSIGFSIWSLKREARIKRLYRKSTLDLERHEKNSEEFLYIAECNAECDRRLFDIFFYRLMRPEVPCGLIVQAIFVIDDNIEKTLGFAVSLFDAITGSKAGDRPAVCVKIIDLPNGRAEVPVRDLQLRTYRRDPYSKGRRGQSDDVLQSVRNNSADSYIFRAVDNAYPNQIYVNDDLKGSRDYQNERADWRNDYNATIVCGIPNFHPGRRIPWAGLLCVDNKGGGFNNEIAKLNIKELATRVGIMLYRLNLLRNSLKGSESAP
jgi:hypothetical protein